MKINEISWEVLFQIGEQSLWYCKKIENWKFLSFEKLKIEIIDFSCVDERRFSLIIRKRGDPNKNV